MGPSTVEPCRICGGVLSAELPIRLLGRLDEVFHTCGTCGSLILPSPYWLEESYTRKEFPCADQGALTRSLFIYRCIRRMRSPLARLIPRHCRCLDFGCGRGFLLRLLVENGDDAWGYDLYPSPVLAEDRVRSEMTDEVYHLVTAIEVLEHTLDPIPTLRALKARLHPQGALVVSTELYRKGVHGPDWYYLTPENGQHVTIFSREGFRRAVSAAGLSWACSLQWGDRDCVHILTHPQRRLSPLRLWALRHPRLASRPR